MRMKAIAVCGASSSPPQMNATAEELGRRIVQAGYLLVCGGMGGIMEAACRGGQAARADGASGLVMGILPAGDHDAGNPYCDVVLPSGLGYARNTLVVLGADVVMLVGGSTGTLSEAAYAWQYGKPIIALSETGGWAAKLAGSSMDDRRDDTVLDAASAEQAVALARGFLEERS